MIRHAVLLVATAVACVSCAGGPTYLGFELDIRSAPPPPRVVVVDEPDYDMFRYGETWYVCYDAYWYRSRSYSGPYAVIDVRSVPREVISVPQEHWRHHPHGGPPGQEKRHRGWGA